ncbi:(2Fe-2S)-binding protein [Ruegeria sp. EL01]|uniref:(2Fe-2S)-binding protein n=1 Tax=Ruegeria sp. EL01 TaxID=2107578 RepID=UPI000EA81897|nr:(2Fe-2S)-binding protein [Ruegeria sp. EL01]
MTVLKVNGRKVEISDRGDRTLADALRTDLGLIGARVSCSEGECGSCTILVDGLPQTSCLMLAQQAEGKNITTIEGLADGENLHPIQQAFIEEQGFQCGFCTPGFILSAKAFLEENPNPTADEVSIGMSGNICRCGAYPYIVKAVLRAAELMNAPAQAAE